MSERVTVPALLARVVLGVIFVTSGLHKVMDLPRAAQGFAELQIPMPWESATLVGWTELVCGSLVLVGLVTRVAAVPLICTMIVAIVTAKRPQLHSVHDVLSLVELAYALLLGYLAGVGAGLVSIDAMVSRLLARRRVRRTMEEYGPFDEEPVIELENVDDNTDAVELRRRRRWRVSHA